MGALTFCVYLLFIFLKLIVTCRLRIICVRENNDSNIEVMIIQLIWTLWTPVSYVSPWINDLLQSRVFQQTEG